MLSLRREEQIRMMLAEGKLSQRTITRVTGASRAIVSAIAVGKRQVTLQSSEDTARFFSVSQKPRRCAGCGGLVYLPCHLCRIRRYVAGKRTRASSEQRELPTAKV